MAESDADSDAAPGGPHTPDGTINERILDAFVYVPAGLALSVAEELPRLAARGRERLGVRVSSARAIGQFAVKAGHDEFLRRTDGWFPRSSGRTPDESPTAPADTPTSAPSTAAQVAPPVPLDPSPTAGTPARGESPARPSVDANNAHIPTVGTLSIPGFDALSASQVVQRLDGLNRSELVSVRAYEASTRGRRTILSRVDQLLDERS
jgi:hypothetical protein